MNRNKSHVCIIMDRSGSMQSIAKDMEGGLNTFIQEQKKEPGELTVSFYRFDDVCEKVIDFAQISTVGELKLEPRNMTALNDAIGKAVKETGEVLSKMLEEDRPGLVTIMIVTDGGENASKEYTAEMVKSMVSEQESKYNWKFTYLGANQDSFAVGQNYGLNLASVANYATSNSNEVWKNYSGKMSAARSCNSSGCSVSMAYSDTEREVLNQVKDIT